MNPYIVLAVSGALALEAAAQQQSPIPQLADPSTRVSAITYQSAFQDYVPWREPKLAPWREMNDQVRNAGGHLGIFSRSGHSSRNAQSASPSKPDASHLRPAAPSELAASPPATHGAPKPPSHGHGAH